MSDTAGDKPQTRDARSANVVRQAPVTFKRGLYDVCCLINVFQSLGWQVDEAKWEAAVEGDGSQVPAMLGQVLVDLAEAIEAMTAEELAEALAGRDLEPEEDDGDAVLVETERAHIRAAASPAVRAFRRGLARAKLRAGKTLSDETVRCMRDAMAHHEEALDLHRSAMRKHKAGLAAMGELMDRAGVSDPDDDTTQTIQTSDGTDVSDGSENDRSDADYRRRQADLMAFAPVE